MLSIYGMWNRFENSCVGKFKEQAECDEMFLHQGLAEWQKSLNDNEEYSSKENLFH